MLAALKTGLKQLPVTAVTIDPLGDVVTLAQPNPHSDRIGDTRNHVPGGLPLAAIRTAKRLRPRSWNVANLRAENVIAAGVWKRVTAEPGLATTCARKIQAAPPVADDCIGVVGTLRGARLEEPRLLALGIVFDDRDIRPGPTLDLVAPSKSTMPAMEPVMKRWPVPSVVTPSP